jgi:uncharacterized membrane protein
LGKFALAILVVIIPFATAWMGENHFASDPTAIYGAVLFMAAVYFILEQVIIANEGSASPLKKYWVATAKEKPQ